MSLVVVHLLQSTAFALLIALFLVVVRGSSPRLRYALLLVALARFALPPMEVPWPVPAAAEAFLPVVSLPVAEPPVPVAPHPSFDWPFAIAAVWAVGVFLSLALWFVRSRRFFRSLEPLRPFRAEGRFPVYLSDGASSPLACGVFHRRIVLPAVLVPRLSSSQLETVLLHESIHLRHHDNLVAGLSLLLRSVYWFHPLVWWLDRQALIAREFARDEEALSHVDPRSYAEVLITVCQSALNLPGPYSAAMPSHQLQERITFAMQRQANKQTSFVRRLWIGLSVAAALASTAIFYSEPVSAQQPRSRSGGASSSVSSVYAKWASEDVPYIITFQERMRFEQLRTNEECEAFIEQFWLIRDPTPGTVENEMKEEHYRRIAYANERFGVKGTSGWRTQRGRFYITMGPPDQIEDHPDRQVQMWRYQSMDGVTLQFDLK